MKCSDFSFFFGFLSGRSLGFLEVEDGALDLGRPIPGDLVFPVVLNKGRAIALEVVKRLVSKL